MISLRVLLLLLLAIIAPLRAQTPFWSPSTGPYGGTVIKSVYTPAGTLLAATTRGLFRSTNHGQRWSATAPAIRNEEVRGLAVTPSGAIVAASSPYRYLRSTDDGISWTDQSGDYTPYLIASGPGSVLYGICPGFDPTLCRSLDDGIAWSRVPVPSMGVVDVQVIAPDLVIANSYGGWIASRDSGRTWASIDWPTGFLVAAARHSGDTLFIGGTGAGSRSVAARSTDNGITWSDASAGLEGRSITAFAVEGDGRMLALLKNGVARWSDTAERWDSIGSFGLDVRDWFYEGYFGHIEPAVSPHGAWIHVPTPDGSVRSGDGGATWESAIEGMNAQSVPGITALRGGDVLAGTGNGVFRSSNLGASWSLIDTLRRVNAVVGTSTGTLLAGGFSGMRRSTDDGATWQNVRAGDSLYVYDIVVTPTGIIGAAVVSKRAWLISTSSDDGATWTDAPFAPQNQWETLTSGPSGDMFLATEDRVRRTSDRGATWRHAVEVDEYVTSILPLDDGNLLVGTEEGRVIALDSAAGRLERSGPLDTAAVVALAIDRDRRVYAVTGAGTVFRRSSALSGGWEDISSGVEMRSLLRVLAHPSGYLFLASNGGSVQRSSAKVSSAGDDPLAPSTLDLSLMRDRANTLPTRDARP